MHNFWRLTSAVFIFFLTLSPVLAEKPVRIVGSTAVYGFSTMAAERLGKTTAFRTPIVEATGTGGGIKIFCSGRGKQHPDIVNTSRPMTEAEKKLCQQNGTGDILELPIGYDGIVIGSNPLGAAFDLSRTELSKALAENVEMSGEWKSNPNNFWDQINPKFPHVPIVVLGPTSTLATREVFEDKVIREGCQNYTHDKAKCRGTIREDGHFIEVAEHESVVIQKMELKPSALGFVSYGYYAQNPGKIRPLLIDGIMPTEETIASGQYPIARTLYMYVKKEQLAHNPALKGYLKELFSEDAMGENGYLMEKGLIPLPGNQLDLVRGIAK